MSKSSGRFDGCYLATHKERVFADTPEIFILRQFGQDVYGWCVNQISDLKPIDVFKHRLCYEQPLFRVAMESPQLLNMPIFTSSGNDKPEHVHVLMCDHFSGDNYINTADQSYSIKTLEDFLPIYFRDGPYPFIFVTDPHEFDLFVLVMNYMMENWHPYNGLHGLAYGLVAEKKMDSLDLLQPHEKLGSEKFNSKIWEGAANLSWFHNEIIPSVNRAKAWAYFQRHHPDMSAEDELQAFRMSLAVSEAETRDFLKVLAKYTLPEIEERYKRAIDKGVEVHYLSKFDKQTQMLEATGIAPLPYHLSVAKLVTGINNNSQFPKRSRRSEATKKFERLFSMMRSIIGGR
jgi:hypothetical protein